MPRAVNSLATEMPDFEDCVKYLINLNYLNLSNNNISVIPKEIKYLKNVYNLNLSNNKRPVAIIIIKI